MHQIGQHWIRPLWLRHYVLALNMVRIPRPVDRDSVWVKLLSKSGYGSVLPDFPTDGSTI